MKHWVFDLDGTLVDSLTVHFQTLEQVFKSFDRKFTAEDHLDVLKLTSQTLPAYFEARVGVENADSANKLFQQLTHEAVSTVRSFPGIEEVLTTLKQKGFQLAVWTARDLIAATRILKHAGLDSYFSIIVSGCCTAQGKPHPEGLQKIASHFGSDSSTMVMVGDFDSDMLGAQAFGIKAIRVLWHPSAKGQKCEIANWQFHNVPEFRSWIERGQY